MKTALVAAIVAAVVAVGSASATSWINGRSIRPQSIPANRLTAQARSSLRGQQGSQGAQGIPGPQGPKGDPGIEGEAGRDGSGITNVLFSSIACQGSGGYAVSYGPPNLNGNPSGHFEVCDGKQGATGPQGPQGQPGTPGLGDATLTICLGPGAVIKQAPCDENAKAVQVVIVSSS